MKTNNKGFSLVELIVVIAIMAILAAVAIPTFSGFITKANKASDDQWANDITYAINVSTVLDPATEISVKAAKDNTATVTFKIGDATYTLTASSATATGTGADQNLANEIKSCVDWEYTFKSDKYKDGVTME